MSVFAEAWQLPHLPGPVKDFCATGSTRARSIQGLIRPAMDKTLEIGSPPLQIILRRSARARRFSLRVSRADGAVILSLPQWAPEREAVAFARSQEGWIRRAQAARPLAVPLALGGLIPVGGVLLRIETGPGSRIHRDGDRLILPAAAAATPGVRIEAFVKLTARHRLTQACDVYAGQVGRSHAGLTLRDTRSRWGSCSAAGKLMFSWRLAMAPPEVLDYVAAHEVAHLVEMNHAPAFWAVVRRLMPDYQRHRDWLKAHGASLQAIRFRD